VRAAEAKRKLDAEQVELEVRFLLTCSVQNFSILMYDFFCQLMRAQGTPEGEIVVINEMFDESAALQSAFEGNAGPSNSHMMLDLQF
jgi:hypothetical protein